MVGHYIILLTRYLIAEYIGFQEQTRGTETSQYLEERTSTETPLVVASERGPGRVVYKGDQLGSWARWVTAP